MFVQLRLGICVGFVTDGARALGGVLGCLHPGRVSKGRCAMWRGTVVDGDGRRRRTWWLEREKRRRRRRLAVRSAARRRNFDTCRVK